MANYCYPYEHTAKKAWSKFAQRYQDNFGVGLVTDENDRIQLSNFLEAAEHDRLIAHKSTATQIINEQSRDLALSASVAWSTTSVLPWKKCSANSIRSRQMSASKVPIPAPVRMSRIFIGIFIILLPFSMVPELMAVGGWGIYLSVPISALIGWVYVMMEVVADYSENPFQGMANDIPMLSLCRTIEIDLREMLGETDLPPAVEAVGHILM